MGFDLIVPVVGASDLTPSSYGKRKSMQAGTPAVPGKTSLGVVRKVSGLGAAKTKVY
jgi:hypothetical protein